MCVSPNVGGSETSRLWECGLALVALKRTGCDVRQMECQESNITANVQSDHLLHGYMLPVFFATDQLYHPPCSAENQPMSQQDAAVQQIVRIANWYLTHVKKMKKMKNLCNFYKVVGRHFLDVVGKEVTVCLFWDNVTNRKHERIILLKNDFWISQGKVVTVYRWGGQVYKLLMSNFLRIWHTKNH